MPSTRLNLEGLCVTQQIRRKFLWLFTWPSQGTLQLTAHASCNCSTTCFLMLWVKTTFWWQYFFTDAACSLLYVGCRYLFVAMWLNLSYYTRDTVWLLLHVDVRSRQTFRVEYHFPFTLNWEELCVIQQIRRKLLWLFTWQGQGILQLTAHVSRN